MAHEVTYVNVVATAFPPELIPVPVKGCKKVTHTVSRPVKGFWDVTGKSVESTNALDKSSKFIVSILRLVNEVALNIFKVALGPLKLIIEEVGAFSTLFGGLNFISRISEWMSKGRNGKSFCHPSNNTKVKVTSRALLTVAHGIEGGIFLQTYGLANFAQFINFLGRIPILGLIVRIPVKVVKDAFVLVSASFGIWANCQAFGKAKKQIVVDQAKLEKWQMRKTELVAINEINAMRAVLKPHIDRVQLEREPSDKTIETLFEVHKSRVELKTRQWELVKNLTAGENYRRAKVRAWVSIAYDIAKIAITATMILGWILNCKATLAFIFTAGIIGLVSNSLGWGKILADAKNGRIANPKITARVDDPEIARQVAKFYTKQTYIEAAIRAA